MFIQYSVHFHVMNDRFESLPLFPDEAPPAKRRQVDARRSEPGRGRASAAARSLGSRDPHLIAANRLARAIRRLPDHSPEQTRTGQAICRHLLALLEEAERR